MAARTPTQVKRYDAFKLIVTAILLIVIIILLIRCSAACRAAAPTPAPAPPSPTPVPATSTPVSPSATPEPTATTAPTPTPKLVWATATPQPAPAVSAPTLDLPDVELRAGELTFEGTGTPGSTVRVIVDGRAVEAVTVGQDGRWSLPVTVDEPGEHQVQLEALDESGNVVASQALSLNVAPAFAPLQVGAPELGAFLPAGGDRATASLTLSGQGEPGTVVEAWAGDQRLGSTTVGSDGYWTFDQEVTLPSGAHDVFVRMLDADGRVLAASDPFTVEVKPEIAAPTVRLSATDGELALEGTGTPGSTLQIVVDGQTMDTVTVGEDGRWSYVAALDPGDYELAVQAVDTGGNVLAESGALSWTQPEPVKGPALTFPAGGELRACLVGVRGTGEPGAEIEVLDDGAVVGTAMVQADGTWAFEYALDEGAHALAARYAGEGGGTSEVVQVDVVPACPPGAAVAVAVETSQCPDDPPHGIDQGDTYVVAWCETMALIAQRTGVRLRDLIAVNPQVCNPNLIYVGQVLNLPPRE